MQLFTVYLSKSYSEIVFTIAFRHQDNARSFVTHVIILEKLLVGSLIEYFTAKLPVAPSAICYNLITLLSSASAGSHANSSTVTCMKWVSPANVQFVWLCGCGVAFHHVVEVGW